eukprot:352926-Chlamydomonas_euryale.AAC.7
MSRGAHDGRRAKSNVVQWQECDPVGGGRCWEGEIWAAHASGPPPWPCSLICMHAVPMRHAGYPHACRKACTHAR